MARMHDSARSKTTVYAAIELSKKSWVVAIARPDRDRPSIHRIAGGNLADLIGRLRKAAGEKQRIVVCYEAGYDGFWLARSLAKIGIDARQDLALGGGVALELVCHDHPRNVSQALQQLAKNRLAAVALRRLWTRMSRTFPSWSTARQR